MRKRTYIVLIIGLLLNVIGVSTVLAEDTEIETFVEEAISGGWTIPGSISLTEEASAAFNNATERLTGTEYEPLALLGTQIVAGTNYSILCKSKGVYPSGETTYAILYIYQDLQGNVDILRVQELELTTDEQVEGIFSISIQSGEDMIVNCPQTAKSGEEVEIETLLVTDATLTISVKDASNGEELGGYLAEGRYVFAMPEDDVIVDVELVSDQPGA